MSHLRIPAFSLIVIAACLQQCSKDHGLDGLTSLVSINTEAAGKNCAAGGLRIDTGIDKNKDGLLSQNEIQSSQYVCNGVNGINGANGTNGMNGADGMTTLISMSVEPASSNCPNGGYRIFTGFDLNKNHVLDPDEVTNAKYVCNGSTGIANLIRVSADGAVPACPYGGYRIDTGLDLNGDGVLSNIEITNLTYLCNLSTTQTSQIAYPEVGYSGDNILFKSKTIFTSRTNSLQCKPGQGQSVKVVITAKTAGGGMTSPLNGVWYYWVGSANNLLVSEFDFKTFTQSFTSIDGGITSTLHMEFDNGTYQVDYYENGSEVVTFGKTIVVKY